MRHKSFAEKGFLRLSGLRVIRNVWATTHGFHRIIWLMILIGVLAAMAETIGITVLVSLVFIKMSDQADIMGVMQSAPNWLKHLVGAEVSLPVLAIILTGTIVLKLLLSISEATLSSHVGNRISERVRQDLYNQLLDVSFNDIKSHDRSELLTILATDTYTIAQAFIGMAAIGVHLAAILIFGVALVALSWKLALVAVIGGLLHTGLLRLFSRSSSQVGKDTAATLEKLTNMSWTTMQAMRSIRVFGVQSSNKAGFAGLSQQVTRLLTRSADIGHGVTIISEAVTLAVLIVVLVLSGRFGIPFQSVLAATALLYRLQPHVREFDRLRLRLHEWEAPIMRTIGLLERADKTYLPAGHLPHRRLNSAIEFRDVTYTYPGMPSPSINRLSFTIPAGKVTAIRGASGAGKSTIINLMLRLMVPDSGEILVDGVNLQDIRIGDWLRATSIAGQDVELIEGTVRENIMMMREGFSDAQMRRAAEIAGIADFIDTLPDGYEEWLGDEALNISGGQRQRMELARAMISYPDVLILDEATNALDDETERMVLANIRRSFKGRTLIYISHRPFNSDEVDHTITLSDI
jgi:ATP-binding cassette subfamily B protein/subfamily B ATP-binding cassette protein MsbA